MPRQRSKGAIDRYQKAAKLFASFPSELLLKIIEVLEMGDLMNIRATNQRLHNLVNCFMHFRGMYIVHTCNT